MDRACHKMISPHINDLKQDFHTLKLICNTLNRSRSVDKFALANHTNSTCECEISDDRIENCETPNFQVWSVSQGLPVPPPGLPPHSWLNQYTAPPHWVAAGFKVSQPPTLWLKRILIFSLNSFLESRPFPLFYADCRKISQMITSSTPWQSPLYWSKFASMTLMYITHAVL